jgi:hypothetical protein
VSLSIDGFEELLLRNLTREFYLYLERFTRVDKGFYSSMIKDNHLINGTLELCRPSATYENQVYFGAVWYYFPNKMFVVQTKDAGLHDHII